MREVEFWRWYMWNNQRTKKVATKYRMDAETALAQDPEAERVPGSVEGRMVPESNAEHHLTSRPVRRPAATEQITMIRKPSSGGSMDTIESDAFEFWGVVQAFQESREIGLSRRPPTHVGIESAHVRCKACGHEWVARAYGPGSFGGAMGAFDFTCPACSATEFVPAGKLMKG